jgi:hypothetical protein
MKRLKTNVIYLSILSVALLPLSVTATGLSTVDKLLSTYKAEAKLAFSAKRGEAFWQQTYLAKRAPGKRSCASCHSDDLRQAGKHVKTGKKIDAMALSINKDRLQKTRKIEKWFKRNCKWTFGRVCTSQEKGDVLEYLSKL